MKMIKKYFKFNLIVFVMFIFAIFSVNANVFNNQGDFTVTINNIKQQVFNDNISANYFLYVKNNKNFKQNFDVNIISQNGWDISYNTNSFSLKPEEEIKVQINFKANSNFNYKTDAISPDTILISQKKNYIGSVEFPIEISGDNEKVNINLQLDINKKETENEIYSIKFSTKDVSPKNPLNFAIKGENILESQKVNINLQFAGKIFNFVDTFDKVNNYHIYKQNIPADITPGVYDAKVTVRLDKKQNNVIWEWESIKQIEVSEYVKIRENIDVENSFFKDTVTINIENLGNKDQQYVKEINSSFLKNLFLHSDANYTKTDNGIKFTTNVKKGEENQISYSYNYIPLYLILLIIVIVSTYVFVRKNSNPVDVEVNLYNVKRTKHEGVKSLKVKIGFENLKDQELDNLSLIFRMPKYLNIKDNSFLLTPPNSVLKGNNQYKLVWNFKRFEKDESRILGFTLVNARGILGDVKIPDLEIEVKNKGKIKKYYKSIPVIKG